MRSESETSSGYTPVISPSPSFTSSGGSSNDVFGSVGNEDTNRRVSTINYFGKIPNKKSWKTTSLKEGKSRVKKKVALEKDSVTKPRLRDTNLDEDF